MGPKQTRIKSAPINISEKYRRIYDAVRQIPYGQVATYGQIARVAGLPGQPRQVGYALHASNAELELPWHRVINASGKISLPVESGHYDLQRTLLEGEGIEFNRDKVSLSRFQWPYLANAKDLHP